MTFTRSFFVDTPFRRRALIHALVVTFNFCNIALYFESSNEFGEHYGFLTRRLTELDNRAWFISPICFFSALLFHSNQSAYVGHVEKLLPQTKLPFSSTSPEKPKPAPSSLVGLKNKLHVASLALSAMYKGAVASSSFAAFLKSNIWRLDLVTIPLGFISFVGSAAAQWAVLAEKQSIRYTWHIEHYWRRWIAAHIFTLFYNIPNTVLYFNTGDEFLRHIGMLDHRLTEAKENYDYLFLAFLGFSSVLLLISTQRSYSQKLVKFFDRNSAAKTEQGYKIRLLDRFVPFFKFESVYTSFYKATINYIALVSILFLFMPLGISFLVSALCFLGNCYAQYGVLKSEPSQKTIYNDRIGPKMFEPCFLGLWSRKVRRPSADIFSSPLDERVQFSALN